MKVEIRELRETDSFDEMTELLHRAYAKLAAMGFRFVASHQDVEITKERCAAGQTFVAETDGRIAGTITLRKPVCRDGDAAFPDWYKRDDVLVFGQFGVDPELQGTSIGSALLSRIEERARALCATELACDTAEGAKELIGWYERRGFRLVDRTEWSLVNYRSVILSKTL